MGFGRVSKEGARYQSEQQERSEIIKFSKIARVKIQALGKALNLIRYPLMTVEEFAQGPG